MKKLLVLGILSICIVCMGFIFWHQEMKFVLPTPVPGNYHPAVPSQLISLPPNAHFKNTEAKYFHFFNPDCPCSRFNLKHFKSLTNQFHEKIKIYAVIPAYADLAYAKEMIDDERVTVLHDLDDTLAQSCGVYSTPQAVVIDTEQRLYFRGNYNRTRYCTLKESNYAELALTAFVKGEAPPVFNVFATQAYGCELPSDQ